MKSLSERLCLWGFGAVAAASLAILAAPLAAYVLILALFGLPHVLCELRYCDERFSGRIGTRAKAAIGALLVGVIGARIGQATHVLAPEFGSALELGSGAALALIAASVMPANRLAGALIGLSIAVGIVVAPITTFLAVAWLHNLTPLAFVAETMPREERGRAVALLSAPFLLWPLMIALGVPQAVFGLDGVGGPSMFDAGRAPLSAFLPTDMDLYTALPLFSAAVAAQAMHYFAVIVVMPRLLRKEGKAIVAWPSWRTFYIALAILSVIVFAIYAASFHSARSAYGVAAAVHTWVELPLLLIALGQARFGSSALQEEPKRE